jgi:ABC-type multidrug transport system fused ATPase/permease subunit
MKLSERFSEWRHGLSVARRFYPDLQPHRWKLALIGIVTATAVGAELLAPWPIKWIIDQALHHKHPSALSPAQILLWGSLAAVAVVLVDSGCDYIAAVLTNGVSQAVARTIRHRVFDHLSRLSPAFFARYKSGDLLVRLMGDVPLVRAMLVDSTIAVITRALLIFCTLGVMIALDARLTLIVIGLIPFCMLSVWWIARRLRVAARKQRAKEGELADYLHEAIAANSLIQSLGASTEVVERFARSNRSATRAELKSALLSARLSVSIETIFGVCTAAALFFGGWRVLEDTLTTGQLIVFLSYVRSLLKPVRATGKHTGKVSKGMACTERLLEVLDEPVAVRSQPGAPPAPLAPRELVFADVGFGYREGVEALSAFHASFRRGELIGLFGRSGSGKSTVAALAVRLFDPDTGTVALDGRSLCDYELESLRARFGLALQDSVLFGTTIRENLLLGRTQATDDELWAALRAAAADEFVAGLAGGLDCELGSGGVGLSGGERRRISLARTLLRRSPIVIVDEPFAGLDRVAVERVRATLEELARESIVIVIAHDLDHLEVFDRILFLCDGRIEDEGTHMELVARNALYRRMTRAHVPQPS